MPKSIFTDGYRALQSALVSARKTAGLTQQELAEKLGKPQSYVSKYELGERRLDVVEFIAVARALGADIKKIIQRVEDGEVENAKE